MGVIDRLGGYRGELAYKAPCRCATTAPVVLSGYQTIDGVVLADGDSNLRVLVKDQSDSRQNGIYRAGPLAWQRERDFNGNTDFVQGTRVYVLEGTDAEAGEYVVSSPDPQIVGTTNITFDVSVAAVSATNLAEKWASNPEDIIVANLEYSAKHYALKAADAAADAMLASGEFLRVSTRLSLKAIDTNAQTSAFLTESGRSGLFVWRLGNYSTHVAEDSLEGVYLESDDVAVTTGAWVRVYDGALNVKWFGATGDNVTDDRAACQAAVDMASFLLGGDVEFPSGTYALGAAASNDSLSNGIVVPWASQFDDARRIRLIGTGRATLRATANSMIVIRVSRPGTQVIGLIIDGGKGAGLTGTWGIGCVAEDRTQTSFIVTQSNVKVSHCLVQHCTEGYVLEPGPSIDIGGPGYSGSGAYYPIIESCDFNLNLRSMFFMEATNDPLNRTTRGNITNCRIERGNTGIELVYATEFVLSGLNFQFFRTVNGGTSPNADCSAIRLMNGSTGLSPEGILVLGGEAEGCDFDIYNAATLPNAVTVYQFGLGGVNFGMSFSPVVQPEKIRLTRRSASYEQISLDAHHSNFGRLIFDKGAANVRDATINTNGVDRWTVGATGIHTFYGTTSNIILPAAGTAIQSDRTSGAFSIQATGTGGFINLSAQGGTTVTLAAASLFPTTDNVMNLGNTASFRWKEIFCALGTINTSDAREKTELRPFTDAELKVAARLAKLTGVYQWLKSVEEKGADKARKHIGITVQAAIECFEAEGLNAFDYGMICLDKWEDIYEPVMGTEMRPVLDSRTGEQVVDPDTGQLHFEEVEVETEEKRLVKPAGYLFGLRETQVRAFVQASQEQRQDAQDTAIANLVEVNSKLLARLDAIEASKARTRRAKASLAIDR